MNTLHLLQAGLLLHITGLSTLVGATLANYILQKQFQRQYKDRQRALTLMHLISKLRRLAGVGLGLQILSGVMMLAATGGGYGQQLWFKMKMLLVIVIIACTIALSGSMQNRLQKLLADDITEVGRDLQIGKIAARINYVQLSLLVFFMIIFILSVFRFN